MSDLAGNCLFSPTGLAMGLFKPPQLQLWWILGPIYYCLRCDRRWQARRRNFREKPPSNLRRRKRMRQFQILLVISIAAFLFATSGDGNSTKEASASRSTPAILSGYCGGTATTGPGVFFLYGLGQVALSDCGGTSAQDGLPIPSQGKLRNLRVADLGSGGETLSILVNGIPSTLSCVVDLNTKTCSDTTHVVSVLAGDLVAVQVSLASSQYASQLRVTMEKQ